MRVDLFPPIIETKKYKKERKTNKKEIKTNKKEISGGAKIDVHRKDMPIFFTIQTVKVFHAPLHHVTYSSNDCSI